jgi:tagatose 6-phosphate kinase
MEKPNRITTLTLNPSIDTLYRVPEFHLDMPNRSDNPLRSAGGKGLNVTRVIRQLGEEVTATGFAGGNSGLFIFSELQKLGVNNCFIEIQGETRTCLAIVDSSGIQTELLESGPEIQDNELESLNRRLKDVLAQTEILIISGSLPRGIDSTVYQDILKMSLDLNVKVLLDTSGQTLRDCLSYKPFMIKPNLEELEQLLNQKLENDMSIWKAIDDLQSKGIPLVVVSNGEKGAYAAFYRKKYYVSTVKINAVSAVGSGDSFVGGIAVGLANHYSIEETLSLASACGTANALEVKTGYVELENVRRFQRETMVTLMN